MNKPIKTRAEFQQLAGERLDEAATLLAAGKWGGAYYLAGYAVELALKACVIKWLMATDSFPKQSYSKDCYTHNLETLVELAGLGAAFDAARQADADLRNNWAVVKDWSELTRYVLITEAEARELLDSIADAAHGVLTWVKTCW